MNFLFLSFNVLLLLNDCLCEIYSASTEIEKLLTTQRVLIDTLEKYITTTESRLNKLKSHLKIFQKENEKADENVEEYLGNPINDYLLIRRLTLDWKAVKNLLLENTSSVLIDKIMANKSIKFPTDEDLQGAAGAIPRLQIFYNLDTSSLASGKINHTKYQINLSAKDAYDLAKIIYKVNNYPFTKLWLQEALIRLKNEVHKTVRKSDILKYLAIVTHKMKDYAKIPKIMDQLSRSLSDQEKTQINFTAIEETLLQIKNSSQKGDDGLHALFYGDFEGTLTRLYMAYKKLCRNEIGLKEDLKAKLKCRYADLGNPFLKLAKFKEEDVFLNPKILLYHDVIFDDEINILKELAKTSMGRVTVHLDKVSGARKSYYRIGQASYLKDRKHPKVAKLSKRVEDITGMTAATAEPLQVLNYGIGGQFQIHVDYFELREKDRYDIERSNSERIATVLFYMNDVELGGATVFPCLKVSVSPKKGAGLFWYNLKSSGAYDLRTQHASCPVLKGYKWICNKWLGEQGQALLRPCGLNKYAR